MTQDQAPVGKQECVECRSVQPAGAKICSSCGCQDLLSLDQSRFAYDAIAAFIGVVVVILFWLGRS